MKNLRGRARFGILVPFTNTNLEPDMALMQPEGISMHFARMGGYDELEVPDEHQMQNLGAADLEETLHLLAGVKPDVVLYGCTSATLTHGPEFDRDLAADIKHKSNAQTVTAAGALVYALETLGVEKIGFASPYVPAINDMAISFLEQMGIRTAIRSEVAETLDNDGQGGLLPEAIVNLGLSANSEQVDAVVLSCTDMRSVEVISELENQICKPVISSNQAMLFQALQLIGFEKPVHGFGQLLEKVAR